MECPRCGYVLSSFEDECPRCARTGAPQVEDAGKRTALEIGASGGLRLENLLRKGIEENASDLHLMVGSPPAYRIGSDLSFLHWPALAAEETRRLAYEWLSEKEIQHFEAFGKEFTKCFTGGGGRRFRLTITRQKGCVSADIRFLPTRVPSIEELELPQEIAEMTKKKRGLVLITGRGAMGKTTTLAAMIDKINEERGCNIITIEDPIEYVFTCKKSLVSQREVGLDTDSFASALKAALRQDADVIAIGELLDQEALETAIWAAETGHLIFATMHTYDVGESVDRIVNAFPTHEQERIMAGLATALEGVISQQLIPRRKGDSKRGGRIAAVEVIPTNNIAIRRLIREGKLYARDPYIKATRSQGLPVLTMDDHLARLYREGKIDQDTMLTYLREPPA